MELFLLRHGIAVEPGTGGFARDSDRPLTDKGERKLEGVVEAMRAMELTFDLIFASPYLRARQTAEIVADGLKRKKAPELTETLVPGADVRELIHLLNSRHSQASNILLVGHEPFLSGLISFLVSGHSNLPIAMKKGGLCKLTIETLQYGRCATLDWLLTPGQMALMS